MVLYDGTALTVQIWIIPDQEWMPVRIQEKIVHTPKSPFTNTSKTVRIQKKSTERRRSGAHGNPTDRYDGYNNIASMDKRRCVDRQLAG